MPQPSPKSTLSQEIGLTNVTVTYSRPGVKDRTIFGDLVPYDKLWRTGANMSTKLSFSDSVTIGGTKIGRGDYSLLTIPGKTEWTVIINKNAELRGTSGYDENEDIIRFNVKSASNQFTETFTINFNNITNSSANLQLIWEKTIVEFPINTDADNQVMANIDAALTVSPTSYYQAARYYYQTDRDANQALEWINMAIDMGYEKYWVLKWKSQIQAKLGDYKGAIATAEKSKTMADEAGNDDYVKMNDDNIAIWKSKKQK